MTSSGSIAKRLPFFYGWVVIAVAFVSMAIGVNIRTSFSLLFPEIIESTKWTSAATAGVFSFGFVVTLIYAPFIGAAIDRWGPRLVIPFGALLMAAGLALTRFVDSPLELYFTLGALVIGGSVFFSYIGHSTFLPNWFDRRRGLAIGIAYSGVGVGSLLLLPAMQVAIDTLGWSEACLWAAALIIVIIIPLNLLFQRRHPHDLGLAPDGGRPSDATRRVEVRVLDPDWVERDWTLGAALGTARFWLLFLGFASALAAWYIILVHQTRFIIASGFSAQEAAFALGLVAFFGIAGQIMLGHLSDRGTREWGWTIGCIGFALCYTAALLFAEHPNRALLYAMVVTQGLIGYGLAPIFSATAADLFSGPRFGVIFGVLSIGSSLGAGLGPLIAGWLYDKTGTYELAFGLGLGAALVSIVFIWMASPRHIVGRILIENDLTLRSDQPADQRAAAPMPMPTDSRKEPPIAKRVPIETLAVHSPSEHKPEAKTERATVRPTPAQATARVAKPVRRVSETSPPKPPAKPAPTPQTVSAGSGRLAGVAILPTPIEVPLGASFTVEARVVSSEGTTAAPELLDFQWRLDPQVGDIEWLEDGRATIHALSHAQSGQVEVIVVFRDQMIRTARDVHVVR
ncbi:MAG: MFS transporter [Pseudomonadota bacterium]